jgi:serine protease Do
MLKAKLLLVAAIVTAIGVATVSYKYGAVESSHAAATPAAENTVTQARTLPDFSNLVDQAGPAVVNISTVQKARASGSQYGVEPGDPLYEFFRRFQGPNRPEAVPQQGVGSGFVITPDGYILTNAHVVADASEVMVSLTDKREFKAKVIGVDRRTDVALIKIEASGLPTVKTGDSSKVRVGEWVAAIGSPFGFQNSVTAGIVSAKARVLPDESYVPFLQTDAAVNPGNSGGPLFNMSGEVIGINSAIYSRTGGYMGVAFAIPIEVAMKVQDDLRKYGKVSRGRIGVAVQPISKDLAESFGLKEKQGAVVTAVEPDSPAAKAGLVAGDVVLSVNDRNIEQPADLARTIGEMKPGETVTLRIWRKGAARQLRATVGEAAQEKTAAAEPGPAASTADGKLGLAVRPLNAEERKQLGTSGGLVVEEASGAAARAGIEAGDVILAVNNETMQTVEQLRKLVEKTHGTVALLVQREGNRIYIPVKVG